MRHLTNTIIALLLLASSACYSNDALSNSINAISIKLFKKTPETNNTLNSGYCLFNAFALLYPGASGATKHHIQQFFRYPTNLKHVSNLNRALQNKDSNNQLSIHFSIWADHNLTIHRHYKEQIKSLFNSQIHYADFAKPQSAVATINKWVAHKTQNSIQKLLSPNDIKNTTSVLINTLFFHGKWLTPFNPKQTFKQSFFYSGKQKKVSMMHITHDFDYTSTPTMQILSLPYQDKKISLLVLLPKSHTTLNAVKTQFDLPMFHNILKSLKQTKVRVSLPQYHFNTKTHLKKYLESMGLTLPFTNKANFSNMTTLSHYTIKSVIQSSRINVNEEGTKMAVATTIGMTTLALTYPRPIIFNANHPFIFALYDRNTHLIIALGQLISP